MKLVEIILKAVAAFAIVVMGLKISSVFEVIVFFGMV